MEDEEELVIKNTKLKLTKRIQLKEEEWQFILFQRRVLKAKGINHPLNKCIYMGFKKGTKSSKIKNDKTVETLRQGGDNAIEVSIQAKKYLNFMLFQNCRKKKFQMLTELNTKLREERAKKYSEIINKQRKMKAILSTEAAPFKYPNSSLIEEATQLKKLSQSLVQFESNSRDINESFEQSMNVNYLSKITDPEANIQKSNYTYDHKIQCVKCNFNIIGLRQKCALCEFNICEECRLKNQHGHRHNFFIEIENTKDFETEERNDGNLSNDQNINNDKYCELKYYICIDLNSNDVPILTIPYKTKMKSIDLEIGEDIENVITTMKKGTDYPSFIVEFHCDNPSEGDYELLGKFTSNDEPIDQKPFKIMVKIMIK